MSTDDGTGMNKLILPNGYYTFKAIAKKLKERDIILIYDPNTLHSTVQTKLPLRLWRLGRLLCFDDKTEITANSSKTSESMININDCLQTITIICNKVNSSKNILMVIELTFYGHSLFQVTEGLKVIQVSLRI